MPRQESIMVCRHIEFIPNNLSEKEKEKRRRNLESCRKGENLWPMHSNSPPGIHYYCCSSGCFPDIPAYVLEFDVSPKLTRRIFENGGKITLANGNITIKATEVETTKKRNTRTIPRTKNQKTSTKKVPKKSTKTRSATSKRRR